MKIILLITLFFAISISGINAQKFRNLDFSQKCDSSKTGFCYWDLSWGGKNAVKPEKLNGEQTLLITGLTENAVGFAEQSLFIDKRGINVLTVTARVRGDRIKGKGAGLNIGVYDSNGQLMANKDMGGFYSLNWISGSRDWKDHTLEVVVPTGAKKIKIGAILFGQGRAWFQDYRVSLVNIDDRKPNKMARDFIGAVCDTIKKHSLVRDSINIKEMEVNALKIAGAVRHYNDCYLAVEYLLGCLMPHGDHHSFLMRSTEVQNWKNEGSQVNKIEFSSYKVVEGMGYINVPAFHGGNQQQMLSFADSLQFSIQALYNLNIKGWIVDLRQNTGGNMAPMIAGLGPLFSSAKLGSLEDVNGKHNAWYYNNGKYYWDDDKGWEVSKPVTLLHNYPIAVLTSNQTGSSGEAVAISFIGNKNTRSFGSPTWGLTTGNGSFDLPDGSQIYLASTIMTDRNGKKYYGPIEPDAKIAQAKPGEVDLVLKNAIEWLKTGKER